MRAREPSADSETLKVMRLSRRAPPAADGARPAPVARTEATCCADTVCHAGASEIRRARADKATAGVTFFIMAQCVRRSLKSGAYRLPDSVLFIWTRTTRGSAGGVRDRSPFAAPC